jgi:hypothetical protein
MTWKARRGEAICIACVNGLHHAHRVGETPYGDVCLCVCQEADFLAWCDKVREGAYALGYSDFLHSENLAAVPLGA